MIRLKGILFDLDGTLAETLPVSLEALQCTFKRFFGRLFTHRELLDHFGPSEEGIVSRLLPDRAEECLIYYYRQYARLHHLCPHPFPHVHDTLVTLRDGGTMLAVVTAKGPVTTAISLRRLGLADLFDHVECGFPDKTRKTVGIQRVLRKWNLLPDCAAYVGDRVSDVAAARATGLLPIAAAWSERVEHDALEQSRPAALFCSVRDFEKWVFNGA